MNERLKLLREKMAEHKVDYYFIPSDDYHMSEYVCPYFGFRKYISGFTGSAGWVLVSNKEAWLWTDGRYFLQAAKQLEGSGISLMKSGNKGVLTVEELLKEKLKKGNVLGFDGRCVSLNQGIKFEKIVEEKKASLVTLDLSKEVWLEDRPSLPEDKVWVLKNQYCGKTRKEKIKQSQDSLKEEGVDYRLITALDTVAWELNLRGSDVPCTPVFLSYLLIGKKEVRFYVNDKKLTSRIKKSLSNDVTICDYNDIYTDIKKLKGKVQLEPDKANYEFYVSVKDKLLKRNPETFWKAVKEEKEVENIKRVHIKDGVILTKFIYWLKKTVKEEKITEYEAAKHLDNMRLSDEECFDLSFSTIGSYNANGAIVHYSPKEENSPVLKPQGLYLIDSGGQYYGGTTDVTRTVVLGKIPKKWKTYYTYVLQSHIDLANVRFLKGTTGANLDVIARMPLWKHHLDYKHGTGHGVGYILSVHEGPNNYRWNSVFNDWQFKENMITTDEPGIYIENEFGVRIENEYLTVPDEENEYGQFMKLENLTWAPVDLDAIDVSILTEEEKDFLNNYHKEVYKNISPYLNKEEKAWLKEATRTV